MARRPGIIYIWRLSARYGWDASSTPSSLIYQVALLLLVIHPRHHLVNIFRTNLPPCRLFSWPSFYPPPSPPIHPLPWLPGHPPPWPICHTPFRPLHHPPLTGHFVLHLPDHLVIHPLYYIQMRLPDQVDWMDGKCNYQSGWQRGKGGGSGWNKVIFQKRNTSDAKSPPICNIVMTFYQDGQGKSLRDDIGIFEKVCFSRDIVGKYMCVDCIERQLSPKKNRLGGRGQKVPEFQSLIYHRSWVHSSARRCSKCRATEFSVHLFTCWLESQAVPSAQTNDGPTWWNNQNGLTSISTPFKTLGQVNVKAALSSDTPLRLHPRCMVG